MPLPQTEDIESGRSILFVGAGYSAEATNSSNEKIKTAAQLTKQLLDACGIIDHDDYDLEAAAEEYERQHSNISQLLHDNFSSTYLTDAQRIVACQPWYRVYTSNYDDVVERAFIEARKQYTLKEVSDAVEAPLSGKTQVIHIYGNIARISPGEFRDKFLLTERQRESSPLFASPWLRRLSDDVLSAKWVIFVGFSLRDLDLQRMLGQMPTVVRSKIVFIGSDKAPHSIVQRLTRFGQFYGIGVRGFANHLGRPRPGLPIVRTIERPPFVEELTFEHSDSKPISSTDIHYLLATGILDKSKLSQVDVIGDAGSYTIFRGTSRYERASGRGADRPVLVHSDIGNGKSIFAQQCAYVLTGANYRAFLIQKESERDGEVIAFFQSVPGNILVIFDDILKYKTLIKGVIAIGRNDLKVIITARSAIMESSRAAIDHRIGASFTEIDLNVPVRDELRRLGGYLRENGLLGDYADLSDDELGKFLGITCGGQLRDILLALFKTGVLQEKIKDVMANIGNLDSSSRSLTQFGAFLTLVGLQDYSRLNIISDIIGYDASYEELKKAYLEQHLYGLIRMDMGEIAFRSPALAEFMLRNVTTLNELLNTIKTSLFRLNKYYADDPDFTPLSKSLLRFSNYRKLVTSNADTDLMEGFYDSCRVLKIAQQEPLFWVQRSICSMSAKRFDTAAQFVETAYALARRIPYFDTYQIDNHCAKLILTRCLEEGVSADCLRESQAQDLLDAVITRKHDDLYHPLSVMRLYIDIVGKWGSTLSDSQRRIVQDNVGRALKSMVSFSHQARLRFRNISNITQKLQQAYASLE